MSKTRQFKVVRQHQGDRFYNEGETREGTDAEFAHLVPHVLEPMEPAAFGGKGDHDGDGKTGGAKAPTEKAEETPLNKAEPAPANKAASPRKSKGQ